MPKRKYSDDKEEKWRRKIRRYEEKILKKSREHVFSRADDEEFCGESPAPLSGSPQSPRALASIVTPCVTNMSEVDTGQADPVLAQAVTEVSPVEPAPTYTEVNLVSEAEHESADVPPTDPELLLALGTFDEELNEWVPDISISYIARIQDRTRDNDRLIQTHKQPYHPATSQTIGRWIKEVLSASGIDTTIFSAHSTRHASASAAYRAGVSVDAIRKTAGWSDQSATFANFSKRPLTNSDSFVNSLFN